MKYKLVALDLDGTLLNSHHSISAENIRIIRHAQSLGVNFVLVTGRPDMMAQQYANDLQIPSVILANNGASIRDVATKELSFSQFIEKEVAKDIINHLLDEQVYFRIYGLEAVATFNKDEFDQGKNEFAVFSHNLAKVMHFRIINHMDDIDFPIIKIVCFNNNPAILSKIQNHLKSNTDVEAVKGSSNGLDIMSSGVSKGRALLSYASMLGIKPEEIIALGDSENDMSMLQVVGLAIAMDNADLSLKQIADHVTTNNDNDGVAKALIKFLEI